MQFRIRQEDQFKTSSRVPGGQYEFHVGAFGLHGMPSVLMRYMHSIFGRPDTGPPMLGRFVQVYCDDILIFSKNPCRAPGARANGARDVAAPQALRQGVQVSVQPLLGRFPRTCNLRARRGRRPPRGGSSRGVGSAQFMEVRRFLGLANYYRNFVLRFSALAALLTALCSAPRATFRWGAAEQRSFAALKAALTTAPVLRVWDPAQPTRLL